MLTQVTSNADGSAKELAMPRDAVRILSIHIDPGTADATFYIGNESVLIDFTGGPGSYPLASPLDICGQVLAIQNANGDAVLTVVYEGGE